jgi:nitrogen regulatory protein P-II 1
MKEIKAYVHRSRIADVIGAIKDSPAWGGERGGRRHNLAVYIVKGSLVPLDSSEQHYSMDLGDEVVNEYKLELLCEDGEVDVLVNVLVAAACTGQAVAGWVTVSDLSQAVPIVQ